MLGIEPLILGSAVLILESIDFSAVYLESLWFDAFALSLALNGWWTRFEKQSKLVIDGI